MKWRRGILPIAVAPLGEQPDFEYCADCGAFLPWYLPEGFPNYFMYPGAYRGPLCSDCLYEATEP
jgi:hypothetical protein